MFATYLRRKAVCIKLRFCRIIFSFWSFGSLIVPEKLQGGVVFNHDIQLILALVVGFSSKKFDKENGKEGLKVYEG